MPESPETGHLRDIRDEHLNMLINVGGVVSRRSNVFPQLQIMWFDCGACGAAFGPFTHNQKKDFRCMSHDSHPNHPHSKRPSPTPAAQTQPLPPMPEQGWLHRQCGANHLQKLPEDQAAGGSRHCTTPNINTEFPF